MNSHPCLRSTTAQSGVGSAGVEWLPTSHLSLLYCIMSAAQMPTITTTQAEVDQFVAHTKATLQSEAQAHVDQALAEREHAYQAQAAEQHRLFQLQAEEQKREFAAQLQSWKQQLDADAAAKTAQTLAEQAAVIQQLRCAFLYRFYLCIALTIQQAAAECRSECSTAAASARSSGRPTAARFCTTSSRSTTSFTCSSSSATTTASSCPSGRTTRSSSVATRSALWHD